MADKDTIDTTPAPDAPDIDSPNSSTQYAVSVDSYLPYSLRNWKFPPYSISTMKNQKKKENRINDKVTIDTTPDPDVPFSDTPNASTQ